MASKKSSKKSSDVPNGEAPKHESPNVGGGTSGFAVPQVDGMLKTLKTHDSTMTPNQLKTNNDHTLRTNGVLEPVNRGKTSTIENKDEKNTIAGIAGMVSKKSSDVPNGEASKHESPNVGDGTSKLKTNEDHARTNGVLAPANQKSDEKNTIASKSSDVPKLPNVGAPGDEASNFAISFLNESLDI